MKFVAFIGLFALALGIAMGLHDRYACAGVSLNPDGHAGERTRQESRIEELAQKIDALDARVKALEAKR